MAFRDFEQKENIMANLQKFSNTVEKFKGIGIAHDLSPHERSEIKRKVEQAKQDIAYSW